MQFFAQLICQLLISVTEIRRARAIKLYAALWDLISFWDESLCEYLSGLMLDFV